MADQFGDEFISIESYRIPWIIWIQILVTILLIILLFFGLNVIFTSDPAATFTTAVAAAPPPQLDKPSSSNSQRRTNVEGHEALRDEGTSGESTREDDVIVEETSMKESMFLRIFRYPNDPCNYVVLAKQAVLKCLGLDSGSEHFSSCNHQHDNYE